MAQHIPIQNHPAKKYQAVYQSIRKKFEKGIVSVRTSSKFQEIEDEDFKESPDEMIFVTYRTIQGESEAFEIHFDTKTKQITQIYLVK